ncbi:MAG TPA: sigma-70 family RNA polymerase sigma factor [Prolixibacteraceae bacterium]
MGREYQINSDTFLWNDFINGDENAFRLIYLQYVQSLFKYGCNFTHDEAMIKDCIHDVFIDLSKYRSGLSPTNNIKLYLFKSLKRKIISSLGKREIFMLKNDPEKLPFYYTISYEDEIVENEFEQQRYQQLDKAMTTLTPRQREAIYLKFVSGLSYEELAKVMQLNYQSARNLVFRGIEKLRESFPKNLFLFFFTALPKGY